MAENNNKGRRSTPIDNQYGHLQPQATDIEKLVLGALMVDKDAFSMISELVRPETFYEPRNQKIFTAIQTLSLAERPVDIATVTEQLRRDGALEDVGGPIYLLELNQNVGSSAHVEYHAKILAEKHLKRQLISYASRLETIAYDETVDVDDLMEEAEGSLFKLTQQNMKQDYTQIDPVVRSAVEIMQNASANGGGLTGIPTGYADLDDKTSGWQDSDLVILAGRPAMGKTAFALSLAKNIAIDQRIPVGFFSLEMSNVQLVNRLIANVCEVSGKKILNGDLRNDDWERLDRNLRKLEGAPLYIDDTPGMSIFEMRTKARRLVREKKVRVLMIDYLQLMNAQGVKFGSRQEEVSTISRSLKALAKELNIPILALSQLNRGVEGREGIDGKRPQLSDLRESGAIEQDADMVCFVHRPEYYRIYTDNEGNDLRGKAEIIIAKHRKGATGTVLLKFNGDFTRFEDIEDTFLPPTSGGEIRSSGVNTSNTYDDMPFPPPSDDRTL